MDNIWKFGVYFFLVFFKICVVKKRIWHTQNNNDSALFESRIIRNIKQTIEDGNIPENPFFKR